MVERQNMKTLIAQSLTELTATIPFQKITVNDITQNCGVSRGAFYNNFKDKYEVLELIIKTSCAEIVDKYAHESLALSCTEMFRYIQKNISFFKSLSAKRNVDTSTILFEVTHDVMVNFLIKYNNLERLTDDELFIFRCHNQGSIRMISEWIENPKIYTAEKLAELITMSWPIGLSKYLNLKNNTFRIE